MICIGADVEMRRQTDVQNGRHEWMLEINGITCWTREARNISQDVFLDFRQKTNAADLVHRGDSDPCRPRMTTTRKRKKWRSRYLRHPSSSPPCNKARCKRMKADTGN